MTSRVNFIDVTRLKARLLDPGTRVVDCRFDLADPDAGHRAYLSGHIPGAVYADLDTDLSAPVRTDSGRHPLPDAATLAITLGRLGIANTSKVVVYDDAGGAVAARAWWLLRWLGHENVQLLDGGFRKWRDSALPVKSGPESAAAERFLPRPRDELVLTTAELEQNLTGIPAMRLLDARDVARFRGEAEPIDAVAGHIPGSVNLPYGASLNADGTWKSAEELRALWHDALGPNRTAPWAVMCGSGVTACHLAISAVESGYREPRLYVGSWSEWIRDPARPIERGQGPNRPAGAAELA